jgi:hypothetical protein
LVPSSWSPSQNLAHMLCFPQLLLLLEQAILCGENKKFNKMSILKIQLGNQDQREV